MRNTAAFHDVIPLQLAAMTNIDQFESAFKAADKPQFEHELVTVQRVLVITDRNAAEAENYTYYAKAFLKGLDGLEFHTTVGDDFATVAELLAIIEEQKPDLICTHRNLHMRATDYPFSIGVFVEVLTQATSTPVLLLPHAVEIDDDEEPSPGRKSVMAITSHLTGDHHLVSYAAHFAEAKGKLFLTHVEDEEVFEMYMAAIGKISTIDTDDARTTILQRLLQDPKDYVDSCRVVLSEHDIPVEIETVVELGDHLNDYKRLIEKHHVNLLVLNTKDEDQLAMHGLAYPLTVELRKTPMLLL